MDSDKTPLDFDLLGRVRLMLRVKAITLVTEVALSKFSIRQCTKVSSRSRTSNFYSQRLEKGLGGRRGTFWLGFDLNSVMLASVRRDEEES